MGNHYERIRLSKKGRGSDERQTQVRNSMKTKHNTVPK